MAARKPSKKPQHPLGKGTTIGVRLNDQDTADLVECAALESVERNEIVHEATALRDFGMPGVRTRLAELRQRADQSPDERRAGNDRRQPASAAQ